MKKEFLAVAVVLIAAQNPADVFSQNASNNQSNALTSAITSATTSQAASVTAPVVTLPSFITVQLTTISNQIAQLQQTSGPVSPTVKLQIQSKIAALKAEASSPGSPLSPAQKAELLQKLQALQTELDKI